MPAKSKYLVKTINEMRELTRRIYVNGFESKAELSTNKSTAMTDKDLARLKTWLSEFYESANKPGKTHRIVIDSRNLSHNPLYNAYKMKSFNTPNSIELHFKLMDYLADNKPHEFSEILANIDIDFTDDKSGRSMLRTLLTHYCEIGLIEISHKDKRSNLYQLKTDSIDLSKWEDAINFFSEYSPVGLIGSFLLDKKDISGTDIFKYKHNYLLHALDSHIIYDALDAIYYHKKIKIHYSTKGKRKMFVALPIRLFVSTQRGYMHLLVYKYEDDSFEFLRVERISDIEINDEESDWQKYEARYSDYKPYISGVNLSKNRVQHIEILIHEDKDEQIILNRLRREKRNGSVEQIDEETYKYTVDTYDAKELFPWIRTFIGKIESFTCSNKKLEKAFWDDIDELKRMYSDEE